MDFPRRTRSAADKSRSAHTLGCLRFARWITPPPPKTRFRMAGQLFGWKVANIRRTCNSRTAQCLVQSSALPGKEGRRQRQPRRHGLDRWRCDFGNKHSSGSAKLTIVAGGDTVRYSQCFMRRAGETKEPSVVRGDKPVGRDHLIDRMVSRKVRLSEIGNLVVYIAPRIE
jgi:hypothetical protein